MNKDTLEQEPSGDAIDRAEAMTEIMMFTGNVKSDEEDIYIKVSDAVQLLRELPPVNPQEPKTETWSIKDVADTFKKHGLIREQEPKTGHWIMHEKHRECSKCTVWLPKDMPRNSFCPNCGAKMIEPQESEDKT